MITRVSSLSEVLSRSGLSNGRMDALCKEIGVTRAHLVSYSTGEKRPAPWLARALAEALGESPEALFPRLERRG